MWLYRTLWKAFKAIAFSLGDFCGSSGAVCFLWFDSGSFDEFALFDGNHTSRSLSPAFFCLKISMNVLWILGNVRLEPVRTWMAPTDAFARLGIVYSRTNVKVRD